MSARLRVLVVVEDIATRGEIERTLRLMGAEAVGLRSGDVGNWVNRDKVDGVFLDWDNRDRDSSELVQAIRTSKSNSGVPIAIMTSRRDTKVIAEGFEVGANFFLPKPVTRMELAKLLNAARGSMVEERRRYQRVPLEKAILFAWGLKRDRKTIMGKTVNVSSGGLLARLHPQPEAGTAVTLKFQLPVSGTELILKGMVGRTGPGKRIAVQFVQVSEEHRALIEEYVEETLPQTPAVVF